MKLNKLLTGLILLLSVIMLACEDDGIDDDNFTHAYEQTQCSDPWGDDRDAQTFTQAVTDYLQTKGISILDSEVESVDGAFCEACTCPTGNTLKVRVSAADGQALLDLNEGWQAL